MSPKSIACSKTLPSVMWMKLGMLTSMSRRDSRHVNWAKAMTAKILVITFLRVMRELGLSGSGGLKVQFKRLKGLRMWRKLLTKKTNLLPRFAVR